MRCRLSGCGHGLDAFKADERAFQRAFPMANGQLRRLLHWHGPGPNPVMRETRVRSEFRSAPGSCGESSQLVCGRYRGLTADGAREDSDTRVSRLSPATAGTSKVSVTAPKSASMSSSSMLSRLQGMFHPRHELGRDAAGLPTPAQ